MYASFALGLSVLTERLLLFPWIGGDGSTVAAKRQANEVRNGSFFSLFVVGCEVIHSNLWLLTFTALVLGHHPLEDHSHHLSDGGGRCVVSDIVLGEVQPETKHDGLTRTLIVMMTTMSSNIIVISIISVVPVLLYL